MKIDELKHVALCGRPNVGKSSLFNRLIGRRRALVLDEPGVTRDVYRNETQWNGFTFELADLAGLETMDEGALARLRERKTQNQNDPKESKKTLKLLAEKAALDYLEKSDLALFVVDARTGVTPDDERLARVVRARAKNVMVILSKVESDRVGDQAYSEVATLGFDEPSRTSAEHNLGIGDLKERVLKELFGATEQPLSAVDEEKTETSYLERGLTPENPIRLGVYGRPNVGKSTLVNELVGEKRMITSPIAGTTVDTIDSDFKSGNKYYRILDTAGIRRKSKTEQGVEVLSVVQALKSLSQVDVALFLIDGYEGIADQDEKVAGELVRSGKPVVLVVNKWDLCRVDREKYAERIHENLGFLEYAPILFVSAEQGSGIDKLWDLLDEILKQRVATAPTPDLNRLLEQLEATNNPENVKIYYGSQTSKNPPTLTILVNDPGKVHFAYERFLKNELRKRYGWLASPLKLVFKSRNRRKFIGSR